MEKEKLFLRLGEPVQCHLWTAEKIGEAPMDFERVQSYFESDHFDRFLLRCRRCGQLYYTEFYEVVDFDNGDDKQYQTFIPIPSDNNEELIKDLNARSQMALLGVSPRLNYDSCFPTKWIR